LFTIELLPVDASPGAVFFPFQTQEEKMFVANLKAWFQNRMPPAQQMAAVYGFILLVVYGWTIYWYFWKLPSWLYFMTVGELVTAYAYALPVNFLESLLLFSIPFLLALLLPPRWYRDQFVAQGTAFTILAALVLAKYLSVITALQALPPGLYWMFPLAVVGILLIVFLVGRIKLLCKILEEIASRAAIFIYVFPPLSALALLVVAIRNL
jgi:hypothetical protein